jgi:hypothetical protein
LLGVAIIFLCLTVWNLTNSYSDLQRQIWDVKLEGDAQDIMLENTYYDLRYRVESGKWPPKQPVDTVRR